MILVSEKGAGLEVIPYTLPNPGPYPYNKPRENSVRFTPTQIEAIKAGVNPGLTMVVGPPGKWQFYVLICIFVLLLLREFHAKITI